MKSKYILLSTLCAAALLASCKKYVEIKTQGNLVPNETINYRYLLNNTGELEGGPQIGDWSSDDVALIDGSQQQKDLSSPSYNYIAKGYTWQPQLYPLGDANTQKDNNWTAMYNTIAYANTVINEVPVSTGSDADKAELLSEALVHRADAYLMLVNTYAKPYNAATAGTDLGVPLILVQTITQSLSRPSVQAVYNQIIADLKRAIPALTKQTYNQQPSKGAGYAELARTYWCMGNYASASAYADSALAIKSNLNDLGAISAVSSTTYPIRRSDPEIFLSKVTVGGTTAYSPTALRLSDELLNLLGTRDQRYTLFTVPAATISSTYAAAGGRFFFRDRAIGEARNIGPSVPEMMLIKAEYLARNNNAAGAIQWVNNLRKKRFKAADYADLTAASATEALRIVVEERRREFFCRMLHWWDMRRLKDEAQFSRTYTRTFNGTSYTLDPASNRYTFQIAPYQIQLNPEIQQNP